MKKKRSNKVLATELYSSGLGYQAISRKLNISRQRVHQLVKSYSSPSHYKNRELVNIDSEK